jgi:hypothetical protein
MELALSAEDLIVEIIGNYTNLVYHYAFKNLKNHHDAEEATKATFMRYFQSQPGLADDDRIHENLRKIVLEYCDEKIKCAWYTDKIASECRKCRISPTAHDITGFIGSEKYPLPIPEYPEESDRHWIF